MNTKYLKSTACFMAVSIIVQSTLLTMVVNSNLTTSDESSQTQQNIKQPSGVFSSQDKEVIDRVKLFTEQHVGLKSLEDANNLVQDVRNLYSRHPKDVLSVQDVNLTDLYKFLHSEAVLQLARVDDEPFKVPTNDEDMPNLLALVEKYPTVGKLYGEPLRKLVEQKKQQQAANNRVNNNHVENKNVFQQFWCKISDSC